MAERRSYAGGVKEVFLVSGINDVATSMPVTSLVGVPDGSNGKFSVVVGKGTPNEEKMLITSAGSGVMAISQRGYDGTTPRPHSGGEEVRLVATSIDFDEANEHVNKTTGAHGLGGTDTFVGAARTQALTNKTMDGTLNTFLNLPRTSMPQIVADLDAEETARAAGDSNRYTKAESDALYATPAYAEDYTDGVMATHLGDSDPHPQYLLHDGTALKRVPTSKLPVASMADIFASTRRAYGQMSDFTASDANPVRVLGTLTLPSAGEENPRNRLWDVSVNIKGFTTSGASSDVCRFRVYLASDRSAWFPFGSLQGPTQNQRLEGGLGTSAGGVSLVGTFVQATYDIGSNPVLSVVLEKLGGSCNVTSVATEDGLSHFSAIMRT